MNEPIKMFFPIRVTLRPGRHTKTPRDKFVQKDFDYLVAQILNLLSVVF